MPLESANPDATLRRLTTQRDPFAASGKGGELDRQWHRERSGNDFGLGATQLVQVQPDIWVANMIAQRGMRSGSNGPPIRYDAVERCLTVVAGHAVRLDATVHLPRIGCGLAGGRWERIEPLVIGALCARDIATTVYDHG